MALIDVRSRGLEIGIYSNREHICLRSNRGIEKSSLWKRARSFKGKHTTPSSFSHMWEKKERVVCLPLKLLALAHKLDFFIPLLHLAVPFLFIKLSTSRSTSTLDPHNRGWKSCHSKFCLYFLARVWFLPKSFNFEVSAVNHLSSLMSVQRLSITCQKWWENKRARQFL